MGKQSDIDTVYYPTSEEYTDPKFFNKKGDKVKPLGTQTFRKEFTPSMHFRHFLHISQNERIFCRKIDSQVLKHITQRVTKDVIEMFELPPAQSKKGYLPSTNVRYGNLFKKELHRRRKDHWFWKKNHEGTYVAPDDSTHPFKKQNESAMTTFRKLVTYLFTVFVY